MTTDRRPGPGHGALALAIALCLGADVGTAAAQEILGVAIGPDGEPLAEVPVVLHRVGMGGGALAGTDTTGADGAFQFPLEAGDSALYFAAVRYEGNLYIGPVTGAGGAAVSEYVLQVSPSSEVGAVGAALGDPGPPPPAAARPGRSTPASGSDAGALWLMGLLALTAAGVFVYTAPRYRRRRTRDAVLEVAGIENRLADPSETLSPDEREELRERRDRLKEQLAPGP